METGFTHDFSCQGNATRSAEVHPRPLLCPLCTKHTGKLCSGLRAPPPPPTSLSIRSTLLPENGLKAQVPTGAVSEHSPILRDSQTFQEQNHLILMCLDKHSETQKAPSLPSS